MKWFYEDIGLNRLEAEEKVLSMNFKPVNRGWAVPLKNKNGKESGRIHIVPSFNHFNVHQDSPSHKVCTHPEARYRVERIIKLLNKEKFLYKIFRIFKKYYEKQTRIRTW